MTTAIIGVGNIGGAVARHLVAGGESVALALWLDAIKEVVPQQARLLAGKVVVDPSNPIGFDGSGQPFRTLPDGQSSGSVVSALLPAGAHYVKAFGTLAADALAAGAHREPRPAVLFYATDDDTGATTIESLIRAADFDPLKAGGVADAGRIERPAATFTSSAWVASSSTWTKHAPPSRARRRMKVDGLHHVTAITADVEANVDFYARLLGLRLVWQGVNADDPEMRHVAYGDERGSPGSAITFFDMPGVARGRPGAGMVHRLIMRVADAPALDFWERRLAGAGLAADRVADQLLFSDPDGLALELVIDDGEDEPLVADTAGVDGQVAIRGMHGVRAYSAEPARSAPLLGDVLGMEPNGEGSWQARGERRHSFLAYDEPPEHPGQVGAGTMHHVAFAIRDGDKDHWRDRVTAAGLRPTPVMDRKMAKSFYFREPSRVLFELATGQPGFVFEPADSLGESLVLDGDLENRRAELEERFPLLANPRAGTTDRAATC